MGGQWREGPEGERRGGQGRKERPYAPSAISNSWLRHCIDDINKCMSLNRLRLNADKTQFIWLGILHHN